MSGQNTQYSGKDLQIVPLAASDIPQVAQAERTVYTDGWSEHALEEALALPHYLFLKAVADGQLAGYCGFQQSLETADITNVTVLPEWRGRSIGTVMLRTLMEQGRSRGVERYTLEVRASNAPALALYKKLGFVEEGVRRDFYRNPREDACILWTPDRKDTVL